MRMSPQEAQQLMQQINRDAAAAGVSPREFLRRLVAGQHVVGSLGAGEIPSGPTYIASAGNVWNDIADEQTGEMDDFEQLAYEREQALVEAGGDDLAREVIFNNRARSRAQANQTISGNPSSAQKSVMGTTAQVASNTLADTAPTVAYWTADDDAESRCVGVTFAMLPVSPYFGAYEVKPFGVVQFGTRGLLALAEVDIGVGCRFSVEASQVILQVCQDPIGSGGNASTLTLSGMLSFGSVSRPTPMTRTVYIENLLSGTTTAGIPIKPFAKSVSFWRAPVASDVTIEFHNSSLGLLYSYVLAANTIMADPIPLANDVTQIIINASGAGNITHGRLIFNLSF